MSNEMNSIMIGFIGAGQMATALAKGFLKAGSVSPSSIVACDHQCGVISGSEVDGQA